MKTALLLLPLLIIIVTLLIRAELREQRRQIYVFKPLATLLVIAVAARSYPAHDWDSVYTVGVLIGLLFSLGGDIALIFPDNRKAFTAGLALFLTAHMVYAVVFTAIGRVTTFDFIPAIVLLVLGIIILRIIQPRLGAMRGPVIAYIIVISIMVSRATAVSANPDITAQGAAMIAAGAILFYISDIILAANRFWKPFRMHRISLAFYYGGQFLIALAASYMR